MDHLQEREQHPLAAERRPDHDRRHRDGGSSLAVTASTLDGRRAPQAEEVGQEAGAVLGGAVALLLPAGGRLLVVVLAQRSRETAVRCDIAAGLIAAVGHAARTLEW